MRNLKIEKKKDNMRFYKNLKKSNKGKRANIAICDDRIKSIKIEIKELKKEDKNLKKLYKNFDKEQKANQKAKNKFYKI